MSGGSGECSIVGYDPLRRPITNPARQSRPHLLTNLHIPTHAQVGFPSSDVVVATAVGSGVASITCGLMGNLPFGLAPGTGLSAYLSYGLVLAGVLTRPQAMTACLLSGEADEGACPTPAGGGVGGGTWITGADPYSDVNDPNRPGHGTVCSRAAL